MNRIRIACSIAGHENDWVEFDASAWGLVEFELFIGQYNLKDGLDYIKRDSTAWHIVGDNGIVEHPGHGASSTLWKSTFRQIGAEGLRLSQWLASTPSAALVEAVLVSRKSADEPVEDGDGENDGKPIG